MSSDPDVTTILHILSDLALVKIGHVRRSQVHYRAVQETVIHKTGAIVSMGAASKEIGQLEGSSGTSEP